MNPIKLLKTHAPTRLPATFHLLFLLLLLTGTSVGEEERLSSRTIREINQCNRLPHSDFLSAQDLDRACSHRRMWLTDRDAGDGKPLAAKLTGKRRYPYKFV